LKESSDGETLIAVYYSSMQICGAAEEKARRFYAAGDMQERMDMLRV